MRRWYISSAAVVALSLVAALVFIVQSSGQAKNAPAAEKQPTVKIAKSRIDKVTAYPHNALVTREVEVPAGSGLIELTITPMPDQIVPSTMYSEGGDGLRVLTTRFTTRQVLEDTSEARRNLEAELEKYQVVASKLASDLASLQKNMELLTKLEAVTSTGKHSGDEVIAMAKYVMEQRTEKAKEMVTINEA
jgi:hypothetical protein